MILMKDIRVQSACLYPDNPVYVKQGDNYFIIKSVWPDTNAAAMGRALYLDIEEIPAEIVNKPYVCVNSEEYREVSTLSQ